MKIYFGQIILGLLLSCGMIGGVSAQDREIVDIEMVLAVDISSSVDPEEYELQMNGLAAAFRHPEVIAAIEGLEGGGIALNLVQWSGTWAQSAVVGWTRVFDEGSAVAFAQLVQDGKRAFPGGATSISGAIHYGLTELQSNNFDGGQMVIDIMGDGRGNDGPLPTSVRDRALAMGVTINGVAIINEQPFVDSYYEENVIGGLDSFVLQAEDYEDFARAILEKLLREIRQRSPSGQNVV